MALKDASRQHLPAQCLKRKPVKIAAVGFANPTAPIAWAAMTGKEGYAVAAA